MDSSNTALWGSITISKNKPGWRRLSTGIIFLSMAGVIILGNATNFSPATAFQGNRYVFQRESQAPESTELNQYPPVLEKAAPIVDRRIEPLRQYLSSKNSPLAPYAEDLLAHYHYRLIIAIAFAESNFCKRNIKPHNCWGIGGGNPATYPDYPHAIARAGYFIQKYFDDGLTNPDLMRDRWVGWENHNWILAVRAVALELEEKGI